MSDRNTNIRASQIKNLTLKPEDLKRTGGAPSDGQVPSYDSGTEDFSWISWTLAGSSTYANSFTDGDLSSGGVLTVTHNLGVTYPLVWVYDNNDNQIIPDEITYSTNNSVNVDLSSFGTLSGTWNVRVVGGTWSQSILKDDDNDTKIQVEESADEDKIRFDVAGQEQMVLEDGKLFPTTDDDLSLGDSTHRFKELHLMPSSLYLGSTHITEDAYNRNELNISLLAFKLAVQNSLIQYAMVDTILDEFEDESGVDTASSTNEDYDSTNDLYSPSSLSGKTVTANGDAQIDTAQKKFGTASALFDGTGDYLSIIDSDINFGTGNFTVDFWYRCNSLPSDTHDLFASFPGYDLYIEHQNVDGGRIRVTLGGTNYDFSWSASTNTWYHIAVIRNGNDLKVFIDGSQIGSTEDVTGKSISGETYYWISFSGGNSINGWLDEFRISDIARWTSGFSVPTEEYTADGNTILLLHCNGTDGSTNFEDSSEEGVDNMTLISDSFTAESEPDQARIVIFEEDVDAVTINTDLKGYVSKDGGSTWAEVTLADEGDYASGQRILTDIADLTESGIGSGTSMKWKVVTLNNKDCKIHGISLAWD